MARPIVLIFQELASPQATPTVPDLNTVIVGPAYDLLDYPDDAASIQLSSTYGELDQPANSYIPPAIGVDAVTVLGGAYPTQTPGSIVDHSSVKVYLKYPRIILGSTSSSLPPQLGTSIKTTSTDQTLIELNGMIGTGFVAAGIRAGDRILLTSNAGTPQSYARVVASIGEPNPSGSVPVGNEKYLRISQNLPADGTSTDQWHYDPSGITGGNLRIERELPIQQLIDSTNTIITFPEPGTDKLVIKGGITISVAITPVVSDAIPSPATTTVLRTLSYAPLYLAYRALREDLQEVKSFDSSTLVTINNIPTVTGLGKVDARNPLAVGVNIALQNSGTSPIYGYGVTSDDATGHANARQEMSTRRDLYCFVPLTQDINIHAAYKTEFDAMADPNQALTDGVTQKFRIVISSIPLPVATTLYSGSITGIAQQPTGALTNLNRTIQITNISTGDTTHGAFDINYVLPGDNITIGLTDSSGHWATRRGVHRVSHVNSSKVWPSPGPNPMELEVTPGTSRWIDSAGDLPGIIDSFELLITAPDGTVKVKCLAEVQITVNTGIIRYSMLNPTIVGGPYTIAYTVVGGTVTPIVTIAGFAINVQVNGTSHTTDNVTNAINSHPIVSTLLTATTMANGASIVNAPSIATAIEPLTGSCVATIALNDVLFNRFVDSTAAFLTDGVKTGDTLEIPLDPNDYSPTAFDGTVLSYTIAAVLNENALLIANGIDDSPDTANELPHYFSRDLQNRFIINTGGNSQNHRIRRQLSKDDQILALTTIAQSVRSKRCTITWPDQVIVADLRDGSLPRASASTRTLASWVAGFYIGCQVGGAVAGLPSQHGLTNLGLNGINNLLHSQIYFSEKQLTQLSDGGFFVMIQQTPGALPICIHQLTTDPTALETGELSVVKNVDFISKFFLNLLEPFIGVYNVTQATKNEIYQAITDGSASLTGRTLDRIGPPLISGTVTSIAVSDFDASRIEIYFQGVVPKPLNTIAFHLVV